MMRFSSVIILVFTVGIVLAQDANKLDAQRDALDDQIRLSSDLLSGIASDRSETTESYESLQLQMKSKAQLLRDAEQKIASSTERIDRWTNEIELYQDSLQTLSVQNGQWLRRKEILKQTEVPKWMSWLMIESSQERFKRKVLLDQLTTQYDDKRARMTNQLDNLKSKHGAEINRKQELELLTIQIQKDQSNLSAVLLDKEILLEQLMNYEDRILADQRNKERLRANIDDIITASIVNNIAQPAPDYEPVKSNNSMVRRTGSSDFGQKKGAIHWPVRDGRIVSDFGSQPHNQLKNVSVSNSGIDIETQAGQMVIAVSDGDIMDVISLGPGDGYMVLIRHGKYLTAYLGIAQTLVKSGQPISAGDDLGRLLVKNNSSVLQFQIWKETTKLNPKHWLQPNP